MEQISMEQIFKFEHIQMEQILNFGQFLDLNRFLDLNTFQIWTISEVNSFKLEHFWI
jgi:hypothetical protein